MQRKKLFSAFALFFLFFFVLNSSYLFSQTATYGFKDKYYTSILGMGIQSDYTKFANLNLSLWSRYCGYTVGWVSSDSLNADISMYGPGIQNRLSSNSTNNFRTVMDRIKIERLCYGQRSDYQCEAVSASDDYGFYAFDNHSVGSDISDSGRTVRFCQLHNSTTGGDNLAGLVCSRLRANREQVNPIGFSHPFEIDKNHNFLIKPRIRIPTGIAENNPNLQVCRIRVYSWDSVTVIKDVTIKAGYFKVDNGGTTYNGEYIEEYNLPLGTNFLIDNIDSSKNLFNPAGHSILESPCGVDIRVDWLGNCDMWIDYVRVDDDIADRLLKGNDVQFENWINWEAGLAQSSGDNALKFYIEEFEFNNIPCIAYVNKKLMQYSGNKYKVMCCVNIGEYYMMHRRNLDQGVAALTADYLKRTLIDSAGLDEVFTFAYPLRGYKKNLHETGWMNLNFVNPVYVPSTLPRSWYSEAEGRYSDSTSPALYDDWFQGYLDNNTYYDSFNFTYCMKLGDAASRLCDKPFVNIVQAHLYYEANSNGGVYIQREPTNEETKMMTYTSVTYGARAQYYFSWDSHGDMGTTSFVRSLGGLDNNPRDSNVYYQYNGTAATSKARTVGDINGKLNAWSPYLMSFDNTNRHSYIYYIPSERTALTGSTYFNEIDTYPPDNTHPDNPNPTADPQNNTYIQSAVFKSAGTNETYNRYFMLVNRRCSPYISGGDNGGRRYVKIKFNANASDFSAFNNWKIINVTDSSVAAVFNKQTSTLINLGWYLPGEGKLYRVAPVMQEGGTLVTDESFGGVNFTCKDTVFNGGKNITITGHTSAISFTDSAMIVMNGGTFLSSVSSTGPGTNYNTFQGFNSHKWNGLWFSNANVQIYNSKFLDINSTLRLTYAVNSTNCLLNDIRYNTFTSSTDTAGGVNAVYSTSSDQSANTYIMYNTFTMNNSFAPAVQVQGFAGQTVGTYMERNTLYSNGNALGMFLSTVSSGSIRNNTITNFATGINLSFSTIDLYRNTITNSVGVSDQMKATGHSSLNLSSNGTLFTAGFNTLTSSSGSSKNIEVNYSIFNLSKGYNTFDVLSSGKHLYGSFWNGSYTTKEFNNCFKIGGVTIADTASPNCSVTDSLGNALALNFSPHTCNATPPTGQTIVSIGNGMYDTIPTGSPGGGGERGMSNVKLKITNEGSADVGLSSLDYKLNTTNSTNPQFEIRSPKSMYDSVRIQMLYRNYSSAKNLCYNLINTFPDSMESTEALQTLYMASTVNDTSTASVTALKSFYEGLILNHSGNGAMVIISNYLVQKCKVLLRQYSSAMAGFQQIINNNQYNYEGLLARWDYMATSLLMNGGSGGENYPSDRFERSDGSMPYEMENPLLGGVARLRDGVGYSDFDKSDEFDKFDNDKSDEYDKFDDDKSPFTKNQKIAIKQSVVTTLGDSRKSEEQKIERLTLLAKNGDAIAQKELNQKMALKSIVKTERPKNIFEHIRIVNADIQKVFGNGSNPVGNSPKNQIPSVFMLHQNYPNPFNPSATIKYDLPKDAKVTIKIYDIIGREVRTLVNEFKKAGFYQAIFDGTNLASGVYFYRIEAGEFIDSKKMVLIK